MESGNTAIAALQMISTSICISHEVGVIRKPPSHPLRQPGLQGHSFSFEPVIGPSMHMAGPIRKRTRKLRLAVEKKTQFASLEMGPALSAEPLGRIGRVADAGAAEIASQPGIKFCHTLLAMRAMHPWPLAAEMHPSPRDADQLGIGAASNVENNKISGDPEPRDGRPHQRGADGDKPFKKPCAPGIERRDNRASSLRR